MKILILALLLTGCFGWSKQDTMRELAFAGVTAADWYQTEQITHDCNEVNPMIGKCGNGPVGVDIEMPTAIISHVLISGLLPTKYRHMWQYVTIGTETLQVASNYRIGYGYRGWDNGWYAVPNLAQGSTTGLITVQPGAPSYNSPKQ